MMKRLSISMLALGAVSGCFYPDYYVTTPQYYYAPRSATTVYAVPPQGYQGATSAPPAASIEGYRGTQQPADDPVLKLLEKERDAAEKALEEYRKGMRGRPAAPTVSPVPPRVPSGVQPQQYYRPHSYQPYQPNNYQRNPYGRNDTSALRSSLGLSLGARSLDQEIEGMTVLAGGGVVFSHRFNDSRIVLDLEMASSGFVRSDGGTDRVFTTMEASAGLRYMDVLGSGSSGRAGNRSVYVGAGIISMEIMDIIEDSTTSNVLFEDYDSASGSYICAGIHFSGNGFSSGELELRRISDTEFTTFGVDRSTDGIQVLAKLSLVF